jgi:hypothetical protein
LNHKIIQTNPGDALRYEHVLAAGPTDLEQGELPGAIRRGCETGGDIGKAVGKRRARAFAEGHNAGRLG